MTDEHPPEYEAEYGVVGFTQEDGEVMSALAVQADPSEGSAEVVRLTDSDRVDDRSDAEGPGEAVGLVYGDGYIGQDEITVHVVYLHEESGDWWTVETETIDVTAIY